MKNLLSKATGLLTAVSLSFSLAATQVAADQSPAPNENIQDATLQTETTEIATLTHEEAIEASAGRFLIHVGEGFSPAVLNFFVNYLEEAGLRVEVANGGPDGQITSFIYGNHYPDKSYGIRETGELAIILIGIAEQNNLYANRELTDEPSPTNG